MLKLLISNLRDHTRTLKQQIVNLASDLTIISVVTKVALLSAALSLISVQPNLSKATEQKKSEVNVTFDKNSAVPLKSAERKIEIVKGESEFDKRIREEREAADALRSYGKRVALVRERNYSDPGPLRPIYQAASARFGVPWEIIEAVHQVESGKSGSTSKRSSAGAVGPMQFLPSTWNHYGVDGDGDGNADITNVVDAIYGGANYLAAGGAASGNVSGALFNYNHSTSYVNKVLDVAHSIGYPG